MTRPTRNLLFLCVCFVFTSVQVYAQSLAQRNAQKRYSIDAKRTGTDPTGKDALPRSREFIRTDSTYYVGWMYEGLYKAEYAADYLGYKNAIVPLKKALDLLERDYARELSLRTADLMKYYPVFHFHTDYAQIAYQLMDCYSNIDRPDLVYRLLRHAQHWNFQREYGFQVYNYLAWTVHRNRFYTSSKYSFLKNNIGDNERLAQLYLDSAMLKIQRDKKLNVIFQPEYEESDKQSVYHYRAMLYSYALRIDSASKYYNKMRNYPYFSHNNFATFLSICGDFRQAEQEYKLASMQDGGDKRLQEWAYYSSILDIYKAQPGKAVQSMRDMIKAVGSTPGFGWYNIALARACTYSGDIDESRRYLTKAEGFKELHIGTTLGQSHYDFSINLVKMMNGINKIQQQKFENRNWWYNPSVLSTMATQVSEKYLMQYMIVNQFATNPERDMVVYKLFSTESTVSWDEIWYLIRDFTTKFFIERFEAEVRSNDQRRLIKKYFNLFIARLQMKKGNYKEARDMLEKITEDIDIDEEYEKLFVARVYEALAGCAEETGDDGLYDNSVYRFYTNFPQLLPYSDIKPNMRLTIRGNPDKAVISRLRDCNINWISGPGRTAPEAILSFGKEGKKNTVTYTVIDRSGREIVKSTTYSYIKADDAGINLAYRLFGIIRKPQDAAVSPVAIR